MRDNVAGQVMNFYGYGYHDFKVVIFDNIFEANVVPASSLGSNAILVMGGSFSFSHDSSSNNTMVHDGDIWQIHSNTFHNPLSLYEMSTVGIFTSDNSAFKINATDNFFTLDGKSNLSSSLIDDRLFDDDEGLYPEVIFEFHKSLTIHPTMSPLKYPSQAPSNDFGLVIDETISWMSDHSPVLVEGMLYIVSGGILFIGAGTTVVFQTPSSGILVEEGGQLVITGEVDNRVILKANEQQTSWRGIIFEANSVSSVFDADMNFISGSVIQYADIVLAGYSSSSQFSHGLSMGKGVCPYLFEVDMIACGGYYYGSAIYIQELTSIFVARNLTIRQSQQTDYYPKYGLLIAGYDSNSGGVILDQVDFNVDAIHYLLFIDRVNFVNVTGSHFSGKGYLNSVMDVTAQHNIFLDTLQLDAIGAEFGGRIGISHNSFQNGLEISYLRSSSFPSFVSNNLITNHHLYYYSHHWTFANITVSGNTIQESSNGGIYLHSSNGWVSVFNNSIVNCRSTWHSIVELFSDSLNELHFENNQVVGNEGYHIFHIRGSSYFAAKSDIFSENVAKQNVGTGSFVLLSSYPWANFSRNVFVNNTAPFSIEVNMSSYHGILTLPFNFWGLFQSDILDLRKTVIDGFAHISQPAIIDFNPVLSGPSSMR